MRISHLLTSVGLMAMMASSVAAAELRIGVRAGGESMDPHLSAVGNNIAAIRNVYDALVSLDTELQPAPGLAESWEIIDDTTWHFKLREGVTFHDGSSFEAADVIHSLERIPVAAGSDGGLATYIQKIASFSAVDDMTVEIKTHAPAPTLLLDLSRLFILPSETALDTPAADFNNGGAAIGTGPFKVVSFTPKADLVLEPHADYWKGASEWEKVTFTEISNDSARVAALLSGGVDLINAVPPGDVPRIEQAGQDVYRSPSAVLMMLFMDFRDTTPMITAKDGSPLDTNPLLDLRVRQAISMAVNREAIASRIMEDNAVPANQFITEGFFGYNDELPELGYDPEAAKALLAEAGYPDGFAITVNCTADSQPADAAVCAALGPLLSQIGLQVTVTALPRAVFFPGQANFEYSLMMNGWGSQTGEGSYILSTAFHTRDAESGYGGFNHYHYSNPDVDAKIQAATTELDAEKRRELLEDAMAAAVGDLAAIPLVNLRATWAGNPEVVDFVTRIDQETLAINATPAQ